MRLLHPAPLLLAVALLVLSAATAQALININLPIAKIYESVKAVAVASVVSVNPENRVIELKTSEQLKGAPVGETFRVQIAAPAELIAKIATGQPLVIMVGLMSLRNRGKGQPLPCTYPRSTSHDHNHDGTTA